MEVYCAHHATCPFFKYWIAQNIDAGPLMPIQCKKKEEGFVYLCRALQYCESSRSQEEKFLESLSPPIRLDDTETNFEECSVIAALNDTEDLLQIIKRHSKR